MINSTLVHPRLTDYYGVAQSQATIDFAVPFFDRDIPLYVDPFLLWKSPSLQDQSLHSTFLGAFNEDALSGRIDNLVLASECDEVGLGTSTTKVGRRISRQQALDIADAVKRIASFSGTRGLRHIEELQLSVQGISKDRVSDFACSYLKSFLIDYTIEQCDKFGIPREPVSVSGVYDFQAGKFKSETASLPFHPESRQGIILVPKHWLRHSPWIDLEDFFRVYCPRDDSVNIVDPNFRVRVLLSNRENYGRISEYIALRERTRNDCSADPLFKQMPTSSALSRIRELEKLPSGNKNGNDKKYEDIMVQLISHMLYPQLDFAADQARTDSGVCIRDLILFNNRSEPFTNQLYGEYDSSQIVFEMKNVARLERDHVNQINRYLGGSLGRFGVLVTRHRPPREIERSLVDLWSAQRKVVLVLDDTDVAIMARLFEAHQREPLDGLKSKFSEFLRSCPS